MKGLIWGMVVLLLILHQDNWNWENSELHFGFLPTGLLYHACLSVACGVVWFLATRFAWPEGLENEAASDQEQQL